MGVGNAPWSQWTPAAREQALATEAMDHEPLCTCGGGVGPRCELLSVTPVLVSAVGGGGADSADDEEGGFGCVLLNACGLSIFIAGLNSRRVWVGSVGCVL